MKKWGKFGTNWKQCSHLEKNSKQKGLKVGKNLRNNNVRNLALFLTRRECVYSSSLVFTHHRQLSIEILGLRNPAKSTNKIQLCADTSIQSSLLLWPVSIQISHQI